MDVMNGKYHKHLAKLQWKEASFVIQYVKDFAARRAAEASGFSPDHGYELIKKSEVIEAIQAIVNDQLEDVGIDAQWVLFELVDNHRIARQMGDIKASNTALKTLAQHVSIDALAKQRVEVDMVSSQELIDRMQRGRQRITQDDDTSFL